MLCGGCLRHVSSKIPIVRTMVRHSSLLGLPWQSTDDWHFKQWTFISWHSPRQKVQGQGVSEVSAFCISLSVFMLSLFDVCSLISFFQDNNHGTSGLAMMAFPYHCVSFKHSKIFQTYFAEVRTSRYELAVGMMIQFIILCKKLSIYPSLTTKCMASVKRERKVGAACCH